MSANPDDRLPRGVGRVFAEFDGAPTRRGRAKVGPKLVATPVGAPAPSAPLLSNGAAMALAHSVPAYSVPAGPILTAPIPDPPAPPPAAQAPQRPRRPLDAWTAEQLADENGEDYGANTVTEDSLALEFVRQHGRDYRWSHGMGWMRFETTHWARDDQRTRYTVSRQICRQAGLDTPKEAKRLGSAHTVAAVVQLAEADARIVVPSSAWDANPATLNTPEGLVNLRTGAHLSGTAEYYATQLTRCAPDPECQIPRWLAFLDQVFVGDREMVEFMQRLLGYILTGERSEQKVFFWYGLGANGKSTLADLVLWLLGTYALKLPAITLMQTNNERHPTEIAQLRGRRLAMSSELDEGQFWAESRLKELTGDETITARFMRGDFFEFKMSQKHVIVGNYKPRLRGGDAAMARRFVLVPFLAKFEGSARDPLMLEHLKGEAPGILNWMMEGAAQWYESGLPIPASVATASREYMTDNDDTTLWLAECCILEPSMRTKASDLYESFANWVKSRGQHVPSMRLWGDRMSVVSGIEKIASNGIRYIGVKLNADESARQTNAELDAARFRR